MKKLNWVMCVAGIIGFLLATVLVGHSQEVKQPKQLNEMSKVELQDEVTKSDKRIERLTKRKQMFQNRADQDDVQIKAEQSKKKSIDDMIKVK